MATSARIETTFGRRLAPRHRIGIPARLITLDRTFPVTLEDLSSEGARVSLPADHAFAVGVLRWMDRHCFAEVRWREGLSVGLHFDKPVSPDFLLETVHYAEDYNARHRLAAAAARPCA